MGIGDTPLGGAHGSDIKPRDKPRDGHRGTPTRLRELLMHMELTGEVIDTHFAGRAA